MPNLIESLPLSLAADPLLAALCAAIQPELDALTAVNLDLVANLAGLPAAVLDRLAADRHLTSAEGYNLAAGPAQKAALVRAAVKLHRLKGTPAAVKQAVAALDISARLIEPAQDASLQPFTFALEILDAASRTLTPEVYQRLLVAVGEYKPARSHLVRIAVKLAAGSPAPTVAGVIQSTQTIKLGLAE